MMADLPVSKYAVIFMDAVKASVEILQVFGDLRDALQFMHQAIENNEEFADDFWFKKYRDSPNQTSIYRANWVVQKTLLARYMIVKYDDC